MIIENRLLAALPPADAERLVGALDVFPLKLKEVLHKPGEPIRHVYFPGGGFCSVVTVLQDGTMVEIATVGREGMLGLPGALADEPSLSLTIVQGEGPICYRMSSKAFRSEMDRRGAFYAVVMSYSHALVGFIMQSTACNAVHSVEERLARWLLLASDRMDSREFPLTQEFAAMMLGVSRPTVTIVAGALQKAGLITYHRGHVTILDHPRLQRASCECYQAATTLIESVTANHRVG